MAIIARGRGRESKAHVVGMDYVCDEEADDGPEGDAVGDIDRKSHLKETHGNEGPIPGEDDQVANALSAVLWQPHPAGDKSRCHQQTRGEESGWPSAPVHPPVSSTATAGTLTTVAIMPTARSAPTARARLSGEITSDIAPTRVGGNIPPPRPVRTLSTSSVSKFGANAPPIRGPGDHQHAGQGHGATAEGIGQWADGKDRYSPGRIGCGSQLPGGSHGYLQVVGKSRPGGQ